MGNHFICLCSAAGQALTIMNELPGTGGSFGQLEIGLRKLCLVIVRISLGKVSSFVMDTIGSECESFI